MRIAIGLALGGLERQEHAAADLQRVLDRLQARRIARPLRMSEVRMRGAGGDDEIVVGHFAVRELDDPSFDIDRRRLAEDHVRVFLMGDHGANRIGDIARIQSRGGDLIKQRLKEVEIAAVDEGHPGRSALERLRGIESAEAAAEDHDVRSVRHFFTNSSPNKVIVRTSPSGPSANCTCSSMSSSGSDAVNVS